MTVVGIDPGLSGAMVAVEKKTAIAVIRLKAPPKEWIEFLEGVAPGFVLIERQHAFPGSQKAIQCRCGAVHKFKQSQGVSSLAKQMTNYGQLLGILLALRIPHQDILSTHWMKQLAIYRRGETRTERKRRLKAYADRLFPDSPDLIQATADAHLLAYIAEQMQ